MSTTTSTTPSVRAWDALREFAQAKLSAEEEVHAQAARTGRRLHGGRTDRRPLWTSVIRICDHYGALSSHSGSSTRQAAWDHAAQAGRICCGLVDGESDFDAFLGLAALLALPSEERQIAIAEGRDRFIVAQRAMLEAQRDQHLARAAELDAQIRAYPVPGPQGARLRLVQP